MPRSASSTFLSSSATRPAAPNSACPRSPSLSAPRSTSSLRPPPPGPRTRKFLESNRPAMPIPNSTRGQGCTPPDFFFEGRLALGFSETGHRVAQTADDALLAENDHGVEERRRYGLADDGHARGIDQQAGFHAAGFGHRAGGVVACVVIPLGKRFEPIGQSPEEFRHSRICPEFFFGGGVASKFVAEKCARPTRKIRQQADSRPQQIDGL